MCIHTILNGSNIRSIRDSRGRGLVYSCVQIGPFGTGGQTRDSGRFPYNLVVFTADSLLVAYTISALVK